MGGILAKESSGSAKGKGGNAANKSNLKKPAKKIDRSKIGLPSNFQHTGHIGIGEMRSGQVDDKQIQDQMNASVLKKINLDDDDEGTQETTS